MSGRWDDEYDWRDRDGDRGRGDREPGGRGWRGRSEDDRPRYGGAEDRSWGPRDRVFGESETGASYNRPQRERERYGRDAYDSGYRASHRQEHPDPGYDDEARQRIYREQYGMGVPTPRGQEAERQFRREEGLYGDRDLEQRYAREMRQPASGGTGGYDYERGYGDAGRKHQGREQDWRPTYGPQQSHAGHAHHPDHQRHEHRGGGEFEDKAREAGEMMRRAGQRIAGWFSGDAATHDDRQRYEDFRGHRGVGPRGYKRSDERISDEVHQHLTDDPWLDASEISCSVSGGEVTLSGTVDNREAKHRAERSVEDLSGVTHVQNNLRVRAGNPLTSAGRGYGDSVLEAKMRQGPSAGDDPSSQDTAATRTTTRRT